MQREPGGTLAGRASEIRVLDEERRLPIAGIGVDEGEAVTVRRHEAIEQT